MIVFDLLDHVGAIDVRWQALQLTSCDVVALTGVQGRIEHRCAHRVLGAVPLRVASWLGLGRRRRCAKNIGVAYRSGVRIIAVEVVWTGRGSGEGRIQRACHILVIDGPLVVEQVCIGEQEVAGVACGGGARHIQGPSIRQVRLSREALSACHEGRGGCRGAIAGGLRHERGHRLPGGLSVDH